jgi:hypothetical protein
MVTDEGKRAISTAEPVLRAVEKAMLSKISVKQRGELMDALKVLSTAA